MRTVSHMYDADQLQKLIENTDGRKVYEAMGYLSLWSPITYPICEISISGDSYELFAVYYTAEREYERRYVIGAVWHDDHFGFHS